MIIFSKDKNKKDLHSAAGNRTPVSRVTGGDTNHYTTADIEPCSNSSDIRRLTYTVSCV